MVKPGRFKKDKQSATDLADLQLLELVATKDKQAFEALYTGYYPRLSRYLSRLIKRPELVEEVVNDSLFVVWEKAATYQQRSKVSTWITGIAYLKGIKALEKLKRMPEQQASPLSEAEDLEESSNPIGRLNQGEWLDTGLDQVSVEQRSVVELTYLFGYSYAEIAEIMNCPVNTVKTRMFHARKQLAKLLPLLQEHTYALGVVNIPGVNVPEESVSAEAKVEDVPAENLRQVDYGAEQDNFRQSREGSARETPDQRSVGVGIEKK